MILILDLIKTLWQMLWEDRATNSENELNMTILRPGTPEYENIVSLLPEKYQNG